MRRSLCPRAPTYSVLIALGMLVRLSVVHAQLPTVRLAAVFPSGGKVGTTVEVTITGSDFEDVTHLYFDHPGLSAEPVVEMKDGKVVPPPANTAKFRVRIDPTTPLGQHDIRAVGRYGVSNPRSFVVGDGLEVNETEPNNALAQATRVLADMVPRITVNGQINGATDMDYFLFSARAGQRILIDCQAQRIDSRLNARLALYGPGGKLISANEDFDERDPFLDVPITRDGDYVVCVADQVYDGSPEYFYRLTIGTFPYIDFVLPPAAAPGTTTQFTLYGRNLPGGQVAPGLTVEGRPLEQLSVQIPVPSDAAAQQRLSYSGMLSPRESTADSCIEYRLPTPHGSSNCVRIGITNLPVVQGMEPNDSPDTAQPVTAPCEIYGQFQSPHDVDWYSFAAKANEIWVFEVLSQRSGFPTDPFLLLRRASDGADILNADDDPLSPIGLRFATNNDDPLIQTPALAEGQYLLGVRHLYGATRGDSRYLYRLRIRPRQPGFQLIALHLAPAVPNVAQPPDSLLVRQGGNQHLDIYAIRRDGFNGEITVAAQGLPAGITCPPVTLGPNQAYAPLVFSAADDAPVGVGTITISGTATIDGQPTARDVRPGVVTWTFDPNQQVRAPARLAHTIPLAVREGAPYRVVTTPDRVTISRGIPLKLKLQLTRRGDFKGNVDALTAVSLPPNAQNAAVGIAADKSEAELTLNLPPNVPVGSYTIALRGNAPAVPFTKDPEGKNKQNVQVADISTPVTVTVTDPVAMSAKPAPAQVKKGANAEVAVTADRQGGFAGPVQVQLVQLPSNVTAPAVTIAADATEAKLVITAAPSAAAGSFSNVLVRASVQVNGQNINVDSPFTIAVE